MDNETNTTTTEIVTGATEITSGATEIIEAPTDQKFFTQEELDNIIQKRLAKAQEKAEQDRIKAQRLAEMTAEERLRADMEESNRKMEALVLKAQRAENLELTRQQLKAYGVNTDFAKYLIADDEEQINLNVKEFKRTWETALREATTKAIATPTPQAVSTANNSGEMTKKEFYKLSIQKQAELYKSNPDLYTKLTTR